MGNVAKLKPWLNKLKFYSFMLEQVCLILLSYVSSGDSELVHRGGFIGFAAFSVVHQLVTCALLRQLHSSMPGGTTYSYNLKVMCMLLSIISIGLAGPIYLRHELYCEDYVFSIFAICEWIFVFLNITFHSTEMIDTRFWQVQVV